MDMNNQVKLIDRNKILNNLMEYIDTFKDDLGYAIKEGDEDHVNEISNKIELLQVFVDAIMAGAYKPDTPPVPTIKPGDKVYHAKFKARGEVKRISASGKRALVIWPGCASSYVEIKNLEVVE